MMSRTLPRRSEQRSHGSVASHLGHMTGLAAVLIAVSAVLPFLVGHLFRQFTNVFTFLVQGNCVQRVARGAQSGITYLRALTRKVASCRALHHPLMAGIDR